MQLLKLLDKMAPANQSDRRCFFFWAGFAKGSIENEDPITKTKTPSRKRRPNFENEDPLLLETIDGSISIAQSLACSI